MDDKEDIVMTPSKRDRTTVILLEKKAKEQIDNTQVEHAGVGQNTGLVINKQAANAAEEPPHVQLEFKCFLIDHKTDSHIRESRILKFWFGEQTNYLDKVTDSYDYFREIVKPDDFPRDYPGFITKAMKLLQLSKYKLLRKVCVELTKLAAVDPSSTEHQNLPITMEKVDERPKEVLVQDHLLVTLESAYPNILPMEDLANLTEADQHLVQEQLQILKGKNLIKEMEPGKWVRKVLDEETEVKVVKNVTAQMASSDGNKRPTVAIITSKYYEKLAVDAMMTNKTTFVRYKTEGESNVYTIGDIGDHRVVSTKLPAIGRQMAAQISSGNTTTRLLGTFGDIRYVLMVGVAGSVPHYTDFYKHVRLGDVVCSVPNTNGNMFIFCDKVIRNEEQGTMQYSLKSWTPELLDIQEVIENIRDKFKGDSHHCPWEENITAGQNLLQGQQVDFSRPAAATDRLYMNIGGQDMIEVGHPPPPVDVQHWWHEGIPVIRHGAIVSGKPIVKEEALRLDFAQRHNAVAFDTEFDQVLESIVGNRIDSFAFIRGVCDYLDGTKNVQWQPYSALAAAAYMKTLVENLPSNS